MTPTTSLGIPPTDPALTPSPPDGALVDAVPVAWNHEVTIEAIVQLSRRLFPGPVSFEFERNPEDPSDEYLVFDVTAKGEYKDYRETIFRWHEEVERLVPGVLTEFRLIVHPTS